MVFYSAIFEGFMKAGSTLFCCYVPFYFVSHELLPQGFLDHFSAYVGSQHVAVPKHLKNIVAEVVEDVQLDKVSKERLHPFMTTADSPIYSGYYRRNNYFYFGIPLFFKAREPLDVPNLNIKIGNTPIPFGSKEGVLFQDSMVFSREAKKFTLANGLLQAQSHLDIKKAMAAIFAVPSMLIMSRMANRSLTQYSRLAFFRGFVHVTSAAANLYMLCIFNDFMSRRTEKKILKKVINISPEYARGGVEAIKKELDKNIAVRTIGEKYGARTYKENGDFKYIFRRPRISLIHKLKLIESVNTQEAA